MQQSTPIGRLHLAEQSLIMRVNFVFRQLKGELERHQDEHFPGDELLAVDSECVFDLVEEILQLWLLQVVELGGEDQAVGSQQLPILLRDQTLK